MMFSIWSNTIDVFLLLHLCHVVFVASEYGVKSQLVSTTEGSVDQILATVTRSNLNCVCHCLKFRHCDASVFCSGSCSIFKTRSNKIGTDLINGNSPCTYTIFPARMICGVHGERYGTSCFCDEGWAGEFCTLQGNIWTKRYQTQQNDYAMRAVLNESLQIGARVSIIEDIAGRKILYHPLVYHTKGSIYAQTVYETPNDGDTFRTDLVAVNKVLQLDNLQTVNHVSKSVSSRTASSVWFTKIFTTNQPCLSVSDSYIVHGSPSDCFSDLFNGAELFVVIDGRSGSVQAILDESDGFFFFIFPMQVTMDSNGTHLLPSSPLRWEFSAGSPYWDFFYNYEYLMNGEGTYVTEEEIYASKLKFFVDNSWHKAYSHVNGQVTQGTFESLKNATLSGKRLRIKSGYAGAGTQIVNAEHVYLEDQTGTYYMLQPSNIDNPSDITLLEIRTDGTSIQCGVYIEFLELSMYNELKYVDMFWYVEDRPWHRVLHVGADGTTLEGLMTNLKNLCLRGVRVRVIIVLGADVFRAMDVNKIEMTGGSDMLFSSGPFTASTDQTCRLISYLIGGNSSLSRIQSRTWSLVNSFTSTESFNAETIWFVDDPPDAHSNTR